MSFMRGGKIPKPLGTVTGAINGSVSILDNASLRPAKPAGPYPLGILLADAGAKKKKKGSTASDASQQEESGKVITLIGSFKNPWRSNPEKEKQIVEQSKKPDVKHKWHPTSDDFEAVTGGWQKHSFASFLAAIEQESKGSIRRINVYSHGDQGAFAFEGTVEENGDCFLNVKTSLTEDVITQNEWIPLGGGTFQESLGLIARKLRNRYKKGAAIVFYMCDTGRGGINMQLLQETANAFQVAVEGFSEEIITCVQWDQIKGSKIERGFSQLPSKGGCENKKLALCISIPT